MMTSTTKCIFYFADGWILLVYIRSFHSIYKYLDGNRFFGMNFPIALHLSLGSIKSNEIQFNLKKCLSLDVFARLSLGPDRDDKSCCELRNEMFFFPSSPTCLLQRTRCALGSKSKYNRGILGWHSAYYIILFNSTIRRSARTAIFFVVLCSRPQIVQRKKRRTREE